MRRVVLGALAATVAAIAVLFGGVFHPSPAAPARKASEPSILQSVSRPAGPPTIPGLERLVAARPNDAAALLQLGLDYQQAARNTADPTYYGLSDRALRRALAAGGDAYLTLTGLASLESSRHRFENALALANRAVAIRPGSASAYAIRGDAQLELGRYGQAFATFRRMVRIQRTLASLARLSYAAELHGDPRRAITLMTRAIESGTATAPENTAWAIVQLGNIHFDTGALVPAARAYELALSLDPGYFHAEAGLARVEAARGRFQTAIRLYRRVVDRVPLPQYAIGLGETLDAAGRHAEARRAFALVDAIERLLEANGVRTELETALFDLDHGRDPVAALARARIAFAAAPNINADDVLAWALYRNGRCDEAEEHSIRALRLGTKDALKLFHRGMIERCLGHRGVSRAFLTRALAVNPHFSLLYVPVAREALR